MNKIEEIKEYISLLENSSLSVLEIEKRMVQRFILKRTSGTADF